MAQAADGSVTIDVSTYDVFAAKQFAGNQLAVFSGAACQDLTTEQMQQLAKEMNYAESTFILPPSKQPAATTEYVHRFGYRIFTPTCELPFAGHPTLGTAYHALQRLLPRDDGTTTKSVLLECQGGTIPVSQDKADGCLWMEQQPPKLEMQQKNASIDLEEVAQALDCDMDALDPKYPAHVFSTGGTCFLVVAVKSLPQLQTIHHPGPTMFPFCHRWGAVGIYLVTKEGRDASHSISARSMIAEMAVPEDPATGSACGCFAGWAVHTGFLDQSSRDEDKTFTVGQGHEMGRPSLLRVRVDTKEHANNLKVQSASTRHQRSGGPSRECFPSSRRRLSKFSSVRSSIPRSLTY
ncbi:Trans-2,3-dihydro-3-hydroxyanthranilate isomerase [Seminavis robusta]|uniref:Trans-2,3-dihydro-3-hydroxyanthranilate isomerase n=1 Tax=Seminavis robusta TaxID=568900 RepID=A0A9N8HRW1_9STRA|nr:Trans-2,3-dihydro-3-hydroxyanthranilate isomerase [Seminavis robusta]|eukprot:Sro1445_g273350.1 Trans-2,3-dihydro-3-hydroxyanthranilate isomerase (351) ;mRNA; f:2691-3838